MQLFDSIINEFHGLFMHLTVANKQRINDGVAGYVNTTDCKTYSSLMFKILTNINT